MGRLYRYDKGGQGGGTSASMEERISWLLAQGKIMLNLYQRAPTPTDKERVKGELDSLYKQLTEIYPVLSRQRRYQELLTLQQIQLEIIRIFKRQQAEGVLLASIGATYLVLRQYTKAQHF
ncbi:MAG: hypothetical protein ACFFCO_10750, partial [Promethearchaeota archaeon]